MLIVEQLLDSIEDEVLKGGVILDWHACDLFPRSWIDLVVVLRTGSTVLYDRLIARCVLLQFLRGYGSMLQLA